MAQDAATGRGKGTRPLSSASSFSGVSLAEEAGESNSTPAPFPRPLPEPCGPPPPYTSLGSETTSQANCNGQYIPWPHWIQPIRHTIDTVQRNIRPTVHVQRGFFVLFSSNGSLLSSNDKSNLKFQLISKVDSSIGWATTSYVEIKILECQYPLLFKCPKCFYLNPVHSIYTIYYFCSVDNSARRETC